MAVVVGGSVVDLVIEKLWGPVYPEAVVEPEPELAIDAEAEAFVLSWATRVSLSPSPSLSLSPPLPITGLVSLLIGAPPADLNCAPVFPFAGLTLF